MAEGAVCPVRNCELTVDIVLKCSDGCIIGAHQANLAHFSEAFPTPGSVKATSGSVDLPEDGETLELLMQFMHHHRLPNLSKYVPNLFREPTQLLALGEAAEKYLVYGAMVVCSMRIAEMDSSCPFKCLAYATKFDYPEIANAAAPYTLGKNVEEVIEQLGSQHHTAVLAWVRYRERYLTVAQDILRYPQDIQDRRSRCSDPTGHWLRFSKAVLAEFAQSPLELIQELEGKLFNLNFRHAVAKNLHILDSCPRALCQKAAKLWVEQCTEQLEGIGEFSTFLESN